VSELVFKTAWRQNDPQTMEEAKAFWAQTGLVAEGYRARRAEELGVLAYDGDRLVCVATAELALLPGLRARFAVAQLVVDPEFRRQSVSRRTFGRLLTVIEAWSAEHPEEKLVGMAAVIEAKEYAEKQREPVWPDWGLNLGLVGYTQKNQQIRVSWFRHARV
jgi:GNAT superfamily N-acetyltransferase